MQKVVTLYPEKKKISMNDRRLRVAAYCRVSTEHEEQDGSIELQEAYFRTIKMHTYMKSHNRSVVAFYVAVLQIVLKDSIKTRYDRMYKYTKEWNVLSFPVRSRIGFPGAVLTRKKVIIKEITSAVPWLRPKLPPASTSTRHNTKGITEPI